jgi:hypothetical protein
MDPGRMEIGTAQTAMTQDLALTVTDTTSQGGSPLQTQLTGLTNWPSVVVSGETPRSVTDSFSADLEASFYLLAEEL